MRKLDKTKILSTVYKNWETLLIQGEHPVYSSSKKFYIDIVMNLFK